MRGETAFAPGRADDGQLLRMRGKGGHASGTRPEKEPHGGGEDKSPLAPATERRETPPRAWGRLLLRHTRLHKAGNTPTCVGKTPAQAYQTSQGWKHPHVRGEDGRPPKSNHHQPETPPRAWGRPSTSSAGASGRGNTPTCVGKTELITETAAALRKHPHVRGEDPISSLAFHFLIETPPRAWGRRAGPCAPAMTSRNTPTCVGKTRPQHAPSSGK